VKRLLSVLLPGGVLKLGVDPSRRNGHDNRLGGTDLFIADAVFLSIAKAVVHSRVAPGRHGHGQVDQAGGFGIQDVVFFGACGKGLKGLVLFFR